MDTIDIPIAGLPELETHLQRLLEAPETPLNGKLFDDVELQLTGTQTTGFIDLANDDRNQHATSHSTAPS
jgi:hypothetical protein